MRKSNYKPKSFESLGERYVDADGKIRADTSANIYESLLTSKAFKDLNSKQQIFYVFCKAQYYGKRKPEKDYKSIEEVQGPEFFYLSWRAVQEYGLYTPTSHSNFYRDMSELERHGFIEKVSSGKSQHKKSIYKFSAKWHEWKEKDVWRKNHIE